jgi:hypothetical protein
MRLYNSNNSNRLNNANQYRHSLDISKFMHMPQKLQALVRRQADSTNKNSINTTQFTESNQCNHCDAKENLSNCSQCKKTFCNPCKESHNCKKRKR